MRGGTGRGAADGHTAIAEAPDLARTEHPGRRAYSHRLAPLPDGSTLAIPVVVVSGAQPGPRALAVAAVHGDEMEGVVALHELLETLDPADLRGVLVVIPVANPPAFAAAQRRSALDGLDLNRTFPGNRDGTPSERLAYHLLHDYALRADFVLSLHSWGSRGLVVPYVEFPEGGGESARRSFEAARCLGLPFLRVSRWNPGLLVACAVRAGVPAVETELGGLGVSLGDNPLHYRRVAENLLRHLGMLPGSPDTVAEIRVVRHLEVSAPVGGVLRRRRDVGDRVAQGETVATLSDLHGRVMADVASPAEGWVAGLRFCNSVNPGERVATIFRELEAADGRD